MVGLSSEGLQKLGHVGVKPDLFTQKNVKALNDKAEREDSRGVGEEEWPCEEKKSFELGAKLKFRFGLEFNL